MYVIYKEYIEQPILNLAKSAVAMLSYDDIESAKLTEPDGRGTLRLS